MHYSLKNGFHIATIIIGISLLAGWVSAQEETDHIAIMKLPPYGFFDGEGNGAGYLFDVGNAILKKASLPENAKLLPMKRLFKQLEQKAVDCTLLAATPFTRSHYRLIEPTGIFLSPAIVPKAGIDLVRYEDLQGLSIAIPRGVSFDDRFDQDETLIKSTIDNYRQAVEMLEKGRFDAIVGVLGSYLFNARLLGFQADKIFGKPLIFKKIPIWLVCNQDGPSLEIESKLKNATSELRRDGAILKIVEKYLGVRSSN
ncbi:MAG: transporter substrate-binding domain-containing protein [Sneathiella sp.]|nr:transporter substrate-binding domain-containing protein [Sneathiella sp.]